MLFVSLLTKNGFSYLYHGVVCIASVTNEDGSQVIIWFGDGTGERFPEQDIFSLVVTPDDAIESEV